MSQAHIGDREGLKKEIPCDVINVSKKRDVISHALSYTERSGLKALLHLLIMASESSGHVRPWVRVHVSRKNQGRLRESVIACKTSPKGASFSEGWAEKTCGDGAENAALL